MPKKLAIFDFDHTLIKGDSFWPFLGYAVGRVKTYAALAEGLALLARQGDRAQDARSFIKAHLLRRLLAGKKRDDLIDAAVQTRRWQIENTPIINALIDHSANGDTILIASGGLDLYLPELLRDIPHDALICTDIGVENGTVTGAMINGNCVRARKAERVRDWLAAQEPFDDSIAYGNYPHDIPMMQLARHRIIVS